MDENKLEVIIARLKKILAIANDAGANESERDNAMRMSHTLLVKYNLSMTDVETNEDADDRGDSIEFIHHAPWAAEIVFAICELYFCRAITFRNSTVSGKRKHVIVGKPENRMITVSMINWLIKTIMSESSRCARQLGNPSGYATSFRVGASLKIRERVKEMKETTEFEKEQAATESGSNNLPVLASLYKEEFDKNKQFILANYKTQAGKAKNLTARNTAGYEAGVTHGSKLHLGTQIGA